MNPAREQSRAGFFAFGIKNRKIQETKIKNQKSDNLKNEVAKKQGT
jgi:hypothetical protein